MAVLGRLLVSSAERLDLPDFLSIDSYAQGDFKYLMKSFVGSDRPYVLAGFDVINPGAAIGTQNVSIKVADSIVYYPQSLAGPFFHGLEEGNTLSTPLVPELRKNSTNYVYLTLTTTEAAKDTRAFWDPDKEGGDGGEFTQDINTQTALVTAINVSTSSFPEDTVPVAIINVGPNFITSIQDARDMMFRLGTGGLSPDPLANYSFRADPNSANARLEPNSTMTNALDPNAFQGGDKNILSLKEWMDVVMTKLKELGGTTYWYEDTSTFSLVNMFKDALATSIKSKGVWQSSDSTPGLLTWTEDIIIQSVSDGKDRIIRSGNKVLANDQTMYIPMVRREDINTGAVAVSWFNSLNYVNGTLGAFENLSKGDWIKKSDDPDYRYLRVEEFYADDNLAGGVTAPGNAKSIKLSANYTGVSETKRAVYDKGVYLSADVLVADRDDPVLTDLGGDLYWLAMRSDTIMNLADITNTTLSIAISNHDGLTAKVTSVAHGLEDGQRIGITGSTNFDGIHPVEVEDVDTFYINVSGGPFADEAGQSAFYATVTTQARSTAEGLLLESANHEFDKDQTVQIADTTNYNGTFKVFPTGNTTFTMPTLSAIATEAVGSATAVISYVRTDIGPTKLDQGENKQIGEVDTENLMSFIGMDNASQLYPSYAIAPDYNTLDGQVNYNGDVTDNLTQRVSKLTSMMADKAQDKTITMSASGYITVNNVANATARDISFPAAPSSVPRLNVAMPSSDQNNSITLNGTISLEENQVAYIQIDRNDPQDITNLSGATIANITTAPLEENVYILAVRLTTTEVWLWDGFYVPAGITPTHKHLSDIAIQDRNAKLTEGGTWSWATNTLTSTAESYIQIPGLTDVRNTLLAQSIVLANDGDTAHVEINRSTGVVDTLTVTVTPIASMAPTLNTFVIARRIGSDVVLGTSTEKLLDGQSMTLDQTTSDQTLAYIGAADTADSTPDYTNAIVTAATEVTTLTFPAASALTSGQSFNINAASDLKEYNIYVIKDATGTAPIVTGKISVKVDIVTGDTNLQVAAKAHAVINGISDFNSVDNTDGTITVTNAAVGATTDAANIDMGAGFTALVDAQGAGAANYVVVDDESLTRGIKRLDQESAQIAAAIANDTWKEPVANFAALPATGNTAGDVRLTLDTGLTWYWNASEAIWLPAGGTGGGLKVIGGGSINHGTLGQISFSQDMFLEKIGLDYSDNTIPTSESPIILPADKDVAYVEPNLIAPGGNLTVVIDTLDNVPVTAQVIARRDGNDIIVGSSSTRLKLGESTELYDTTTDQARDKAYGHKNDFFRSDDQVVWTGTELEFSSDILLETLKADGTAQVYTVSNPGASPLPNIEQLVQLAYGIAFLTNNHVAQTFTVPGGNAFNILTATFRMRSAGSTTGTVVAEIWGVDGGGLPDSGNVLGVSSTVLDTSTLPSFPAAGNDIPFSFSGITLAAGTQYAFVVKEGTTFTGSNLHIGTANSDVLPGEELAFATNPGTTGTWSTDNEDAYFIITGESAASSGIAIADGEYAYITADRTQNTQTVALTVGTAPAEAAAGSEVVVLGRRINVAGEGYLHLPLHKQVLSPGQSVRLGASGSGAGNVKAKYLDPTSTTLPTGATVTIDGQAGVDGDTVLFTNLVADNNRIYELSGVGAAIAWTPERAFDGDFDPTAGSEVRIQAGDAFGSQKAVYNGTDFLVNDVIRLFDGVSANFWELSSIKNSMLTDNTTDSVFEVNASGSENWVINYSIVRGVNKETGTLVITSDGTTAEVARTAANLGGANGVTFTADISSGDLRLRYTTTATGDDADLKYFYHRWSNSIGGPTGVPNYTNASTSTIAAAGAVAGAVQYRGAGGDLDADSKFVWDAANSLLNLNGLKITQLTGPVTLLDAQNPTPVIAVTLDATVDKFFTLEYSVQRGVQFRTGRMLISTDGISATGFSDDSVETGGTGIVFSANTSGTDLQILYTSTSAGANADFKYTIRKWN